MNNLIATAFNSSGAWSIAIMSFACLSFISNAASSTLCCGFAGPFPLFFALAGIEGCPCLARLSGRDFDPSSPSPSLCVSLSSLVTSTSDSWCSTARYLSITPSQRQLILLSHVFVPFTEQRIATHFKEPFHHTCRDIANFLSGFPCCLNSLVKLANIII